MNPTFDKARLFMYRNARPLDLARFQYHFENGSRENVVNVLSCYQNEDGGFGHAVEADCWNPNSTPLHTSRASTILMEIGFDDRDHPLVQRLLKWYASGKNFDGNRWAITVESNNDYPHAPWWHSDSVSACHTDYNGTAQIAGFIVRYADRKSDIFRLGVRIANEAVAALPPESIQDMHTCGCYVQMMESFEKANAAELIPYDLLKSKLHRSVKNLIDADKSNWGAYVCKPSQFMHSRDSAFYAENREIAEYECGYIINTQLPDGSWDIPWHWDAFPDEWAISKNWWKGNGIIQNLLYLNGFGML